MKNKDIQELLDSATLLLEQLELMERVSLSASKKIADFLQRVEDARRN